MDDKENSKIPAEIARRISEADPLDLIGTGWPKKR